MDVASVSKQLLALILTTLEKNLLTLDSRRLYRRVFRGAF